MMRSMYAAISGLKVHQTMLDVTSNDIANVNTLGYKAQRTTFKDSLSQLQRGAAAPNAAQGGSNAIQVGLGVQLGSIDNNMSTGALQTTGNPLDVALQSDGSWFRVGERRPGRRRRLDHEHPVHPRGQLHAQRAGLPGHPGRPVRPRPLRRGHRRRRPADPDPGRRDEPVDRPGRLGLLRPGRRRRARDRGLPLAGDVRQRGRPAARLEQPLGGVEQLRRRDRRHAGRQLRASSRPARSRCRTSTSPRSSRT